MAGPADHRKRENWDGPVPRNQATTRGWGMTFIEKVKSVTIKNSPGEKARPEVWGWGLCPGRGPGQLPALPVGQVLVLGGGGHPTSPRRARALAGQGWAQSIRVPWKSSTRSLKSGSMRSEGRSPSSLAASLSAPREMRYLGCKDCGGWGGGLQDAHPSLPGSRLESWGTSF